MATDSNSNWELYQEYRKKILDIVQHETAAFDKYMLSLSSGSLVLSIAFIKDLVPLSMARNLWALEWSWILFCAVILMVLLGLQASRLGGQAHLINVDDAFSQGDLWKVTETRNLWSDAVRYINNTVGILFAAALCLTMYFAITNVPPEDNQMPEEKSKLAPVEQKPAQDPSPFREGLELPPPGQPKPAEREPDKRDKN